MAQTPLPSFPNLVSKAESFEFFHKSLDNHGPPTAAFTTTNHGQARSAFRNQSSHQSGRHSSFHRGNGRSNSGQGYRPPRYQEEHNADKCNQRYAQGGEPIGTTTNLVEAFKASYSLNGPEPSDWYLDTGASAHMTPDLSHLDQASNYTSKDRVVVGNDAFLPITHTDTISPILFLELLDVLVVPHSTKNLLSISKLTSDFPLAVTFTNNFFSIQNRQTGRVVATGKRDGGLYVLERGNSAFISILKNKILHASYDLWHARLGHVSHSFISLLNKNGHLYLTSLLTSPSLCETCQIAKNHRLPYSRNE